MIKLIDYIQLIALKKVYNDTDALVIKINLQRILKAHAMDKIQLAELLGVSDHAVISYYRMINKNKPDLYNLLILSDYLKINIYDLFKDTREPEK